MPRVAKYFLTEIVLCTQPNFLRSFRERKGRRFWPRSSVIKQEKRATCALSAPKTRSRGGGRFLSAFLCKSFTQVKGALVGHMFLCQACPRQGFINPKLPEIEKNRKKLFLAKSCTKLFLAKSCKKLFLEIPSHPPPIAPPPRAPLPQPLLPEHLSHSTSQSTSHTAPPIVPASGEVKGASS